MRKTRYSGGLLMVRDDIAYGPEVKALITSLRFRGLQTDPDAQLARASLRRNSLYRFYFPPAGRRLVMKVTQLDPRKNLWRKIDWYQRKLRKNYAETAFNGALYLENAGIDTCKPVAFWSYGTSWWDEQSYFLYEYVDAGGIGSYNRNALNVSWCFEQSIARCMVEKTIAMTRRLHAHGLRHGDIHSGNVLVDFDPAGCPLTERAIASRLRVFLIDTDHVRKTGVTLPVIKRFFDLRCLRCIDFHAYGRRRFLKSYLGSEYRVGWWWVLNFWSRGGFRLGNWFKPGRGAPRLAPVFTMLGVLASDA